jgi:hypothetical protein
VPLVQSDLNSPIPFSPPIAAFDNGTLLTEDSHYDLIKRDTSCQKGYSNCDYMSVAGYCCPNSDFCAIDGVGHVACCPSAAVCTGTVNGGFATQTQAVQQTVTQVIASPAVSASYVPNVASSQTVAAGGGVLIGASQTTTAANGGFVVSTTPVSYLPGALYPFKVIATTYTNAAACSSAWQGCQTDLAKCTSYLAGAPAGGVTISAPNYSTLTPTITLAAAVASSVCSSYSQAACSGLQETACAVFGAGNAAPTMGCGAIYGAGVGAAVGMAGQWLWT